MKTLLHTASFIVIALFCFAVSASAQSGVGKLAGKVVDANTKEPLVGATVLVGDTRLGAATDGNGNYFVLNLSPGSYDVRVSYIGYAKKTIKEVRIVAGITYELNIELTTDLTLPDIIVEGKKLFEEKATNTVKVIDASQIDRLPVKGVANIASLQSGVVVAEGSGGVAGNASINIRGGRGSEVIYIVDGVPQNNLYNRSSSAQVSNIAIEQISFQVGGYEAKYGQAQSGIVNVTTKSGSAVYNLLADGATSTMLDNYGFNEYSASISGPIIPGESAHTIFLSGERGWYMDANPSAIKLSFPSINTTYDSRPNFPASVWRMSGRTNHNFGDMTVRFSGLYNTRLAKSYSHRQAKNDSQFFDEFTEDNTSVAGRFSHTINANTFYNVNLGFRAYGFKRYNPFFKDDLYAYGDKALWQSKLGVTLLADGQRTVDNVDANGIFRPYGYSNGLYQKRYDGAYTTDFDFTAQMDKHLLEFGGGVAYHMVRGYGLYAYQIAGQPDSAIVNGTMKALSYFEKIERLQPFVYGYEVDGQNEVGLDYAKTMQRPKNPLLAYAYIQDRYELSDLVLNIGLRMDYFDVKSSTLKNPDEPFIGGDVANDIDPGDFEIKKAEIQFSPRIGIGFPVTESTVFHAQYGRFIQLPELNDLYFGPFDYNDWMSMEPQSGFNGGLGSEETIQYEVGFRQLVGTSSALSLTGFYKNIKGLVNVQNNQFQRTVGGEVLNAIYPQNADFGTTKGFAFSFDANNISYFSVSAQYTFSIAEGTGSSTSSSQTAIFRNNDKEAPKVIAPLDFDQRHTATVNINFFVPKGQLGYLEMTNANMLLSFNSGRPYTPLDYWDILSGNNGGPSTTGYVNSRYGPSTMRLDLRVEKSIGFENLIISPYLWVINVLNDANITNVWRSTGDPYTTGYLNTPGGKTTAAGKPAGFTDDYKSLERDPGNFGVPRQIRLGVKVNFTTGGF